MPLPASLVTLGVSQSCGGGVTEARAGRRGGYDAATERRGLRAGDNLGVRHRHCATVSPLLIMRGPSSLGRTVTSRVAQGRPRVSWMERPRCRRGIDAIGVLTWHRRCRTGQPQGHGRGQKPARPSDGGLRAGRRLFPPPRRGASRDGRHLLHTSEPGRRRLGASRGTSQRYRTAVPLGRHAPVTRIGRGLDHLTATVQQHRHGALVGAAVEFERHCLHLDPVRIRRHGASVASPKRQLEAFQMVGP